MLLMALYRVLKSMELLSSDSPAEIDEVRRQAQVLVTLPLDLRIYLFIYFIIFQPVPPTAGSARIML